MNTPSFKEDHISQIPALQMLQNLGYIYLSPEEAPAFSRQQNQQCHFGGHLAQAIEGNQ